MQAVKAAGTSLDEEEVKKLIAQWSNSRDIKKEQGMP